MKHSRPFPLKWLGIAAATVLLAAWHGIGRGAVPQEPVITIGVLAESNVQQTLNRWIPTADHLSARIEHHRFSIRALTASQLRQAAAQGSIHYLVINPSGYVDLATTFSIQPVLTLKRLHKGNGYSQTGSVIFCRRDDHRIRSLEDLVGKTFMAVSESSFTGWRNAQAELRRHGIVAGFDLKQVLFGGSHPAVVMAVRDGLAAAGAVAAGTLEALSDRGDISIDAFRILNPAASIGADFPFQRSTGLSPEWLLAAMPNASRQLTERMARLLLDVTPDMAAAKAAGVTGWTPALDYQPVHDAMQMIQQNESSPLPLSFSMGSYSLGLFLILLAGFGGTMWHRHYRNIQHLIHSANSAQALPETHTRPNRPKKPSTPRTTVDNGQGEAPLQRLEQIANSPWFQSTLTAYLVVSSDNREILAANSRAGQLLGYPVDQLTGVSCETLGFGYDPDNPVQNNLVLDAICADGRTVSAKTSMAPMRLAEGEALLISFLDNSETAALKKQLVRAKATADAASTAKGQFLANMNHEIRTPLNGIVSMVDLLMQSPMSDEHLEYVGIIHQSTKALVSIVNDVMDYCKIESGRIKVESAATEIASMVANTAQTYSRIAQTKGVGFSCVIDPKLPKWIRCDPIRLRQIIENMLDNAVKFTQRGNIHLHVEQVARRADSVSIRFQIGDTGIGIEEDRLASIFDSFSQGGGPLIQKPTGIGLGLTIAKHLIGLMGGDLKVASTPEEGTRFWFRIDFEVADTSKLTLRPVRTESPYDPVSDKPVRILLVEDNAVNQKVALKILSKAGFTVEVVDNGRQALDILTRRRFDLILMDIKMPEMDGLETARRIRHPQSGILDKTIPIIAVTANAMRTDRQQCLDCGMNDYLTKPIDAAKLLHTISSWLPKNRRRDDASGDLSARSETMSLPDGGAASPYETGNDVSQQSLLEQKKNDLHRAANE